MPSGSPCRTWPLACLLFVALAGPLRPAGAQAARSFAEQVELANQLAQSGKLRPALAEYQQAYKLRPLPDLLVPQGRLLLKLGRPTEALSLCRRYLQQAPADPGRGYAEDCASQASARLRQLHEAKPAAKPAPPPIAPEPAAKEPAHEAKPALLPPAAAPLPAQGPATPVLSLPAPPRQAPLHRRWWLWTALGGTLAAAVVVGAVLGTRQGALDADPLSDVAAGSRRMVPF